ncbi:MAG: orotidine 5'-phosphate decarboxylase / HUMPS family protein [Promethearchaeota archaeon]
MSRSLEKNLRYVQIAFNHSSNDVRHILPQIPHDPRIIIEAGTPYIKREGVVGIRFIRRLWSGILVADLKVTDGAYEEVDLAYRSGANVVTASGTAPIETLDYFNETCKSFNIYSMIDMLGQENPLKQLMKLRTKPNAIVIHKGRDEEANPRSIIRYKDINKIRSKFDVLVSVAGGLDQFSVRKAYFNGADIAILNIVRPSDNNKGILNTTNFRIAVLSILQEVGT